MRRRGSRAQSEAVRAVRQTAREAGFQLANEDEDDVSHVAQTLAQITEGEDLAQLDGRLTFAERQIDRLANRRASADRLIDSELVVMRTRLEETLRAFAVATQEHKETVAVAERRLLSLANEAERHTRAMFDTLRVELSLKVEEASRSAATLESRLRGERAAFEDEAATRARGLARSIATGREELEARLGAATADLEARLASAALEMVARMGEAAPVDPNAILAGVDVRIGSVEEHLSAARAELLDVLMASEEKALGAAVHLESVIEKVRRRLVGDEAEWSAVIGEAGDAIISLRARVEELLGRICAIEADTATVRGTASSQLNGIDRRLEIHEEWSQAAMSEVSAQALRLNALEAQQSVVTGLRTLAEEQAGTIEYLKGRVQELIQPAPVEAPPVVEEVFDALEVKSDVARILESRLDDLVVGQAQLAKRLDDIESRLLAAPENAARRRIRTF